MSPRGKVQNERMRSETLERITGAALSVFAEYGYNGATMRRIAEVSGLSFSLVYHYFPSKERMFGHLVDFALDGSIAAMRAFLSAPGTAWERLESYAEMLSRSVFSGDSCLYFIVMMQAMTQGKAIPGLSARLDLRLAAYYEELTPVIVEAQKEGKAAQGDATTLAAAFFSFIQGLALLVFQKRGLERNITPGIILSVLRGGNPGAEADQGGIV